MQGRQTPDRRLPPPRHAAAAWRRGLVRDGLLRLALVLASSVLPLAAGEKNGVAPNTVSLPSGPGTIEGLGESFEPMLQTGTAAHGLPLAGAGVGLAYDGGFGNGPAGYGWKFEPGSVSRQLERGIPRYEEPARDDTYLGAGGMELVELQNGYFLPRTGGGFTRHERIESGTPGVFHWQARSRDGTLYVFGESAAARVSLPAKDSADGRERIFRWHIERQRDVHGNTILYEWSDLGLPGDRRKYLKSIRHGPGAPPWSVHHLAVFDYEERPDPFVDCRAGFAVRTAFRLKTVKVGLHGAPRASTEPCRVEDLDDDGADDVLIRRYELLYEGHRHWSLLTQVTLVGCDGVSSLPPASYRYGTTDDRLDEEREFIAREEHLIFSENAPTLVADAGDVELCDLNSDGLPDLVHASGISHVGYLNQGLVLDGDAGGESCPVGVCRIEWSAAVEPESQVPALEHRLSDARVHLADMDADGLADLVITAGDLVKYFPNRGRLEVGVGAPEVWGAAREMSIDGEAPPPPFVFEDEDRLSSVKTLDVDFDRRIDVVRSTPAGYLVWYNRGGDAYSPPTLTGGAVVDGEVLDFRDRRVKLADLNGDGPVDVALIEATRVVYCPSLGHGEYGPQVELAFPEVALEPVQHGRAELKDVNGDGLADLVVERARQDELWFWLNLGPVGLSARRVVRDLHDVAGDIEVDWADMNASGTTDVVYTDSRLCPGLRVRVIDLGLIVDGSSHPRLLKTIDNGLGLRTEISYRTSSEYYQEARAAGNPWATSNPKSVRVVSHVETTTGSDLDGVPGADVYRTDYLYRDGYYDAVRRQFTGFGFVKAIARGDERAGLAAADVSGPSLVTRTRFHVGAPDGVDNDRDGETDEQEEWMGREEEPLKGMVLWSETASLPEGAPLIGSFVDDSDGSYAPDSRVFSRSVTPLSDIEIREVCRVSLSPLAALLGDAGYDAASAERRVVITVAHRAEAWTIEEGRGPPRLVCAESEVNALGDGLWAHALGEIDPVTGNPLGDTRYAETEYAHNLGAWLLGVPVRARARAGGATGRFVSEARSYYDGEPFVGLELGEVGALGLVHRVESFINEPADWTPAGDALPPLVEDSPRVGDPRLGAGDEISVNAARTRHDEYGNVVETRGALHREGVPGHRRVVDYDPYLHAFPVAERIETGGPLLSVSADYQLALGLVTSSVDFNGRETLYKHDVFGRPTALVAPWDSEAFPSTVFRYRQANPRPLVGTRPRPGDAPLGASTPLLYEYDSAGALTLSSGPGVPRVSSVRTSARERAGEASTLDAIAYVDGGGTALAALSESSTPGRWVVSGAAWYNLRGLPRCGFQPYEQEGTAYTPPVEGLERSPDTPGELVEHGDVYYDALGRSLRAVTPPDEDGLRHEARTVYRPFAVDAWDGEDTIEGGRHAGTYATTIVDGLGRTLRVIERNRLETDPDDDATEYVTRYEYGDADALRAVVDAQNNRKHQRHDGLGRRIFLDDLHAGHHFSTYDAAGQLVEVTDAKGQRTLFSYDGAGRELEVNYLDRTGDPATDPWDVRYRYDVSEGPVDMGDGTFEVQQNLLGAMASLEWRIPNLVEGDTFGEAWSSLDDRGRLEWSSSRIPDPLTGLDVHYSTRPVYDHQNRVTESTYPDGDRVSYEYDRLSRVTSVRGSGGGREIIRSVDYHPAGHLRGMVHGNGVSSQLTHDPRLRVRESLTAGAGVSAGAELLHLDYRFDGAGNITSVRDRRPAVPSSQARHDSRSFEYDDLYRLVRYRLTDVAGTDNRGQIDYRHDRIGNLLFRGSPPAGSPGHIDHVEGGKDLVNIGAYTYGGGRTGRRGRAPGNPPDLPDPPGPQAVTATSSGRAYAYDRNGNMTDIDGKTTTWDFADRLVRLEEDGGADAGGKTVEYVYTAGGERLVKKVTEGGRTSHVLYVGPGFEIRDGEEPTKYVFVGPKRVARVKGTLDPTAERIQRLRLVAGWNMVCLAVELPLETAATVFGLGVDAEVTSIYRSDGEIFTPIADPAAPIERGVPYWVFAGEARILIHVGPYSPPTAPLLLSAGVDVVGWPRLEALRVEESFGGLVSTWSFDGASSAWLVKDFDPTSAATSLTGPLAGGLGLWTFGDAAAPAAERRFDPAATAAQDVLFYHSDHLGSAALVTDLDGRVVEETVYYPFGVPRLEERHTSWFEGDYKFTGKERDKESGLYYYGARYYEPVVGRFVSADPLYVGRFEGAGQGLGVYAYVMNNPVMMTDPTGMDGESWTDDKVGAGNALWEVRQNWRTDLNRSRIVAGVSSTVYVVFDQKTQFMEQIRKAGHLGKFDQIARKLTTLLNLDFQSRMRMHEQKWGTLNINVHIRVVRKAPKRDKREKHSFILNVYRHDPNDRNKSGLSSGQCGPTNNQGCFIRESSQKAQRKGGATASAFGAAQHGYGWTSFATYNATSGVAYTSNFVMAHEISHGLGLPHAVEMTGRVRDLNRGGHIMSYEGDRGTLQRIDPDGAGMRYYMRASDPARLKLSFAGRFVGRLNRIAFTGPKSKAPGAREVRFSSGELYEANRYSFKDIEPYDKTHPDFRPDP